MNGSCIAGSDFLLFVQPQSIINVFGFHAVIIEGKRKEPLYIHDCVASNVSMPAADTGLSLQ